MLLTASTIVPTCERQAKVPQATEVQTAISPKFAMPTSALGSDSDVVMLEQESDGMHDPRVTFLSNGRTGKFFLE